MSRPLFILAPMDDVTDTVFRQVVADCAKPDYLFTEFVNVDGLQSPGRPNLLKKMRFTASETPLIIQLWGREPENYYKTLQQIVDGTFAREMGLPEGLQYAGVDINMGCPAKVVVRNGCCSALINDRSRAVDIIKATQAGAAPSLPVSVKTRLGVKEIDMSWPQLLLEQKLNMLTMHGRTVKEMSAYPAHWDKIGEVRQMRDSLKLNTLIIGNGDVESRSQGETLCKQYDLDGVMIGRGIFHDPFVFAKRSDWQDYTKEQRIELFRKHIALFAKVWGDTGERRLPTLNKFCKVYIQNFEGAKELREQLMNSESTAQLLRLLDDAL